MKTIGTICLMIIAAIIIGLLGGYIFISFWKWFILPVFPELPRMTLLRAIGVTLFTSYLFINLKKDIGDQDDEDHFVKKHTTQLFTALIKLIIYFGNYIRLNTNFVSDYQ